MLVWTVLASCCLVAPLIQGPTLFKRSHRLQFRITALAVIALFLAQFGAIAHAYTHSVGASKTSTYQQETNSPEYCGECLSYAPLLSAAGTPAVVPFVPQLIPSPAPQAAPASFLSHRTFLAFRSRAPPVTR